jgi:hypothetical protein
MGGMPSIFRLKQFQYMSNEGLGLPAIELKSLITVLVRFAECEYASVVSPTLDFGFVHAPEVRRDDFCNVQARDRFANLLSGE